MYYYTSTYTKYNYTYMSTLIILYPYTSTYTKYNYTYMSTLIIFYSYTSTYTKYNYTYMSTLIIYEYCCLILNIRVFMNIVLLYKYVY